MVIAALSSTQMGTAESNLLDWLPFRMKLKTREMCLAFMTAAEQQLFSDSAEDMAAGSGTHDVWLMIPPW